MAIYTLDIRQRRQTTFPNAVLKELGLTIGDSFEVEVQNDKAILTPKKKIALDAFEEIQKVFSKTQISEKEMLESIDKQRMARATLALK